MLDPKGISSLVNVGGDFKAYILSRIGDASDFSAFCSRRSSRYSAPFNAAYQFYISLYRDTFMMRP